MKRNIVTTKVLVELPLELGCITCMVSSAPATVLEVSVSHEDSTISHLRDQYYLSLWVGEGNEVELRQALRRWLTYEYKSKMRSYATVVKLEVIKK